MQTWNSPDAAQRYNLGAARRAQSLGPATERLLDVAGVQPGMRVLDIAAGTGDSSIMAARRVQPGGAVLAVDISASMLEIAAEAARAAGLSNLETQVQDANQLDLPAASFDAAISRLGLMFLAEPARSLRTIRCALKRNQRLAAIVWSTRERNPYMGASVEAVKAVRGLPTPAPAIVRAFSLSPADTLASALSEAGFGNVSVEPIAVERAFESVDEAIDLMYRGSTNMTDLLADASEAERAEVTRLIAQRFAQFRQPDGACVLPGEVLLGTGVQTEECYDQSR